MSNRIFHLLLLFCLFNTSCGRLVFWFSGAHDPRLESHDFIHSKAKDYGIDESFLIGLKESHQLKLLKKRFNSDVLFDKNGYELLFSKAYENEVCKGNILQLLVGLGKESFIERDSLSNIFDETKGWQIIGKDTNSFSLPSYLENNNYDYFLVSYWNTFSGKQNNRDRLREVFKHLKNNTRINIKHFLVNQDFREEMSSFEIEK